MTLQHRTACGFKGLRNPRDRQSLGEAKEFSVGCTEPRLPFFFFFFGVDVIDSHSCTLGLFNCSVDMFRWMILHFGAQCETHTLPTRNRLPNKKKR